MVVCRLPPLLLALLLPLPVSVGETRPREDTRIAVHLLPQPDPPSFLHPHPSFNVSAQLGSTVYLHCVIANLRDQSVSWFRREGDLIHLITFGFQTYHDDHRFGLAFEQPEDWRLRILNVGESDEGTYQCQVTTHPPHILTIHLHVFQAVVEVVDERGVAVDEKFYREGSTIQLQCRVDGIPAATALRPSWHRDHHTLNYDDARGGVSVKTEVRGSKVRSWVRVGGVLRQDSGKYTCSLSGLASSSVAIHVVADEHPAAIQEGARTSAWPSLTLIALLSSLLRSFCPSHR